MHKHSVENEETLTIFSMSFIDPNHKAITYYAYRQ